MAAATETLIVLALILGFARKLTYVAAFLFSLLIWSTAEGFGGPYTGKSTDVGTGIIYAVVFASLLALNYEAGPSRFSVDDLIEQRIPWWHLVAEGMGDDHESSGNQAGARCARRILGGRRRRAARVER